MKYFRCCIYLCTFSFVRDQFFSVLFVFFCTNKCLYCYVTVFRMKRFIVYLSFFFCLSCFCLRDLCIELHIKKFRFNVSYVIIYCHIRLLFIYLSYASTCLTSPRYVHYTCAAGHVESWLIISVAVVVQDRQIAVAASLLLFFHFYYLLCLQCHPSSHCFTPPIIFSKFQYPAAT